MGPGNKQLRKQLHGLLDKQTQYLSQGGQAVMVGEFVYFPMSWLSIANSIGSNGEQYKTAHGSAFNTYKKYFLDKQSIDSYFSNGSGTCNATVQNYHPHYIPIGS